MLGGGCYNNRSIHHPAYFCLSVSGWKTSRCEREGGRAWLPIESTGTSTTLLSQLSSDRYTQTAGLTLGWCWWTAVNYKFYLVYCPTRKLMIKLIIVILWKSLNKLISWYMMEAAILRGNHGYTICKIVEAFYVELVIKILNFPVLW